MANIKLGSIVTGIRGSIGGTTFRRTPSGHIAYNKQQRQLKSASSSSSQRIVIGAVMQSWGNLSEALRESWKSQAALFPVKDKFGTDKFLTGRQLYIKLNTQLVPVSGSITNPVLLSTELAYPVIRSLRINLSNEEATLNLVTAITVPNLCISFYQVRKTGSAKPHAHFKVNSYFPLTSTASTDVWDAFIKAFPVSQVGMYVGCNIYSINRDGFKSPVTSIVVLVD